MSTPTESKKSSAKSSKGVEEQLRKPKARIQKRIVLTKSTWADWENNKIQECEFEGIKFNAVRCDYASVVYTGQDMEEVRQFGSTTWRSKSTTRELRPYVLRIEGAGSAGSCAYPRIFPTCPTNEAGAMYRWWLWNVHVSRGTLCFVYRGDAGYPNKGWEERLEYIHETLKRRGFKVASVNKSTHTGHYPVWLYVHPGDEVLLAERNKKNKKKAVKDVDVLGSADAGVSGLGAARTPADNNAAAPAVPVAPAIAA